MRNQDKYDIEQDKEKVMGNRDIDLLQMVVWQINIGEIWKAGEVNAKRTKMHGLHVPSSYSECNHVLQTGTKENVKCLQNVAVFVATNIFSKLYMPLNYKLIMSSHRVEWFL